MRTKTYATIALAVLTLGSLSGAFSSSEARMRYRNTSYRSGTSVPAGSSVRVRLDTNISTDDAHPGDAWSGTVTQSIGSSTHVMIPQGSTVSGVVTSVSQGTHSTRAQLGLAIRQVTVNGQLHSMNADTEPIVAGSNRARKLGAIAGGAAVGALIGHTVAKDNHGTLVGGLLGGAAGYGATRNALRTLQLKPGTELSFTTREQVAMNR